MKQPLQITVLLLFLLAFAPLTMSAQEATETPDTGWPVERRCVGQPTTPPDGWTFDGAILMRGYAGIHALQADWETLRVVASFDRGAIDGGAGLSPDGRWYAELRGQFFASESYNHLYVIERIVIYSTIDRGEVFTLDWTNSYLQNWYVSQMYWLDDELLVYETSKFETDKPGDIFVINPFDGSKTPWNGSPEILNVGSSWGRGQWRTVDSQYVSPDLTRSVYINFYSHPRGVYDVASGVQLRELDLPPDSYVAWMPDSSHFLAEIENETGEDEFERRMILFDRDGNTISSVLLVAENQWLTTVRTKWSPDRRFFAFALEEKDDYRNHLLYLADIHNRQIIDTCLQLGYGVAWSPDSMQLALLTPNVNLPSRGVEDVLVFDVQTWTLYRVGRHIVERNYDGIIGWRAGE